jgi:hypothetical protein
VDDRRQNFREDLHDSNVDGQWLQGERSSACSSSAEVIYYLFISALLVSFTEDYAYDISHTQLTDHNQDMLQR